MRCRRSCRLRRRYGRFVLPKVAGARKVKAATRDDVGWFARTDSVKKEVEFSKAWSELAPEARRYITLHEQAHVKTGPEHNARFYQELKRLVTAHGISWKVAYELESFNCHKSH